ncbi:hypothetical protein GCM10022224_090100 [Nonomuraea antimicrobica]|uniref:Uncharacterized protein n=1 Tax=Nonomuraea antimicrobica TaxID=561173 RepID=A0ABP7DUV8_9ACTN
MRCDRAGSIRALAVELDCSPGRVANALERDGIRRLPKVGEALVREVGGRRAAAKLGCSLARLRAALEVVAAGRRSSTSHQAEPVKLL